MRHGTPGGGRRVMASMGPPADVADQCRFRMGHADTERFLHICGSEQTDVTAALQSPVRERNPVFLLRKAAGMVSLLRNASWLTLFGKRAVPSAASEHLTRRSLTLSLFAWTVLTITTAVAADYPERPVRVIVPNPPGTEPDVTTRAILAELTQQLGKEFVVDYRPGAEGLRATEMIVRAAPDGYTIGQGNLRTLVGHRIFVPKLPYDPDRDVQPVAQFAAGFSILAVALSLPVNSVQELIDHARKNPGKLLFASTGNGQLSHMTTELFKRMTGTQMTHVPYKGMQQVITDTIGGQVHLIFYFASAIGPHVAAGRVRGLAVTTAKRSSLYPELPTVAESGVPNFEMTVFRGIIAPGGVSKTVVNRLNAEVNRALATSTVKDKFGALGTEPTGGTPAEFAALIKRELIKWTAVCSVQGREHQAGLVRFSVRETAAPPDGFCITQCSIKCRIEKRSLVY